MFERPLPDAEDHEVETACESDEEVESMEDSGIHSGKNLHPFPLIPANTLHGRGTLWGKIYCMRAIEGSHNQI